MPLSKVATKPSRRSDAPSVYLKTNLAEILEQETESQDRLVDVTAEIVAVDARQHFINLYDARTRTLLQVSLAQLPKATRRALMREPIHAASVLGRVEKRNGKLQLVAHQIIPHPTKMPGETPVSFQKPASEVHPASTSVSGTIPEH